MYTLILYCEIMWGGGCLLLGHGGKGSGEEDALISVLFKQLNQPIKVLGKQVLAHRLYLVPVGGI
jgi:hypothetical protein